MRRTGAIAKSNDPAVATFFAEDQAASTKSSSEFQKMVEPLMDTEQEKILFKQISEERKAYIAVRDRILDLKKEGKAEEASQLLDQKFTPTAKNYMARMEELLNFQGQDIDNQAKIIQNNFAASRNLMVILGFISLVLSATIAWLLSGSITGPLAQASAVARQVASGDLTAHIDN